MIDVLFEIGISNAVISLAIALVALAVGKLLNRPHLAYLIWLLVLVKLLMPSFLAVPFPYFGGTSQAAQPASTAVVGSVAQTVPVLKSGPATDSPVITSLADWTTVQTTFRSYLPLIWGLGIMIALIWSLIRVFRFNWLLKIGSVDASGSVNRAAKELAGTLDLKKLPQIYETSAEITPMVWWVGGRVRIYIPSRLVEKMDPKNLRMVLAHELAHVRRRDYLVRWLEWFAAIIFWWNPVVWWAQRNLRAYEEICCDALILSSLKPEPHHYASSLLSAVEEFAGSAVRPPSMASEVNSGGYLVRRIHMILSKENNRGLSRWLRATVFCAALLVLPLGLVSGQETDVKKEIEQARQRLEAEVQSGRLSKKEAMAEMANLKSEIELRMVEKQIGMAVAEGKISPEDAAAKMEHLKQQRTERAKQAVELKAAAEELELSVNSGKISKDEAKARMLELKMQYHNQKKESDFKRAAEHLQKALDLEKISAAEAKAKMAALRLNYANAEKAIAMQMEAEKLEYALESGRISKDEAQLRMQKLKQKHAEQKSNAELTNAAAELKAMVQANKISAAEAEAKMRQLKRNYADAENAYRLQSAREKLSYAVESGRISEQEAKSRLEELSLQYNMQKKKAELMRAAAKLKAAVKAGELSEDEAKEKLKRIQEELQDSDN